MAPRGRRGESSEPQAFHQFGVQGRKTGVFLPTTSKVDKDGFQPLEDIFSSPRRESSNSPNGDDANDEDDEGEEDDGDDDNESMDMDITNSAGPGPQTLLRAQRRFQPSPSESRSPTKKSVPAGRAPAFPDRESSPPTETGGNATVTRNLNFQAIAKGRGKLNGHLVNRVEEEEEEEEEEEDDEIEVAPTYDETIQSAGAQQSDEEEEDPEEEEIPPPKSAAGKRKRGRPKTSLPESEPPSEDRRSNTPSTAQPSAKKSRGRPAKSASKAAGAGSQASQKSQKKSTRNSTNSQDPEELEEEEEEVEASRQAKKQRINGAARAATAAKAAPAAAKPKGRPGRKPKVSVPDEDAGEQSFMALQKGPPLPKRRGLVSVKRDPDTIVQTRSGRHSYRPLNYWAGDQVIQEAEELDDMFTNDRGFVSYSMKEIVRSAQEESSGVRRGPRARGRAKGKPKQLKAVDEEEEPDKWESDPGQVFGEVMGWEPEYEKHPPADDDQVPVHEDLIAVSADAVQTKDIKDATFRFAKTLTMPFMGAGIVDLPPGTEKRPKNSRKMHMVFFVHYGKVTVTVNESEFRISAGGQWFVHRGNYYSITNESKTNARIFFSQACEVPYQTQGEVGDQTEIG